MVSLQSNPALLKLSLRNSNLLPLGLLKGKLSRAIHSRKRALSSPLNRMEVCQLRCLLWKPVHRAHAANHPCHVWFKKKEQTKAEHFSVVCSRKGSNAAISSGLMSRLALQVSSGKRPNFLQACHHRHRAIAKIKIFVCPCVCARRGQTQAGGFSNVRSLKVRDVVFLHGQTNQ